MRGILIYSGEANAAKAAGRMTSIVNSMETARQGTFTELLCVCAGEDSREARETLAAQSGRLREAAGQTCTVIPELWELPEGLTIDAQCGALLRYWKDAGDGFPVIYGNLPGRQLGALAAARLGRRCIMNAECVGIRQDAEGDVFFAERRVYSGHLYGRVDFVPEESVLVVSPEGDAKQQPAAEGAEGMPGSLPEGMAGPDGADAGTCAEAAVQASAGETGIVRVRKWQPVSDTDAAASGLSLPVRIPKEAGGDLESAPVVFVGGRGLRSAENFRRLCTLAEKMGAACGCTRPVAMAGWADFSRVVGISGVSLHAKVCVAFGVSGSAAFLCGTEQTGRLVAVNSDKNAPIFLSADTGILGDCMSIIEALEKGEEEGWHI